MSGRSTTGADVVLVTGAAGFVGSTLVDRLLADGREVVGLDAFEAFYPRSVKERNLADARRSSRFRFVELDVRDRDALTSLVRDVRPTTVLDFAARAGVRDSLTDPWLYIDINVRGLQNTITAARDVQATVIFASSSSIYGASPNLPFREDDVDGRPLSPYGATKLAGEALLHAHRAVSELPVRIARLFTVYGPRQRPDLAVHRFAVRILRGEPVPLYSGGTITRDYTFVGDVAEAFVKLIDADDPDLVVNVGSHRPFSNGDLVAALERALGRSADIELLPAQPGDAPATFADITRAATSLGWAPRTSLDDGLEAFRDWLLRDRAAYTDAGSD